MSERFNDGSKMGSSSSSALQGASACGCPEGVEKANQLFRLANWLFTTTQSGGSKPYWPGMLLKRHVQPAAARAGILKQVGWHSFRWTYANILYSNEQNVKTAQELMRHSAPTVTMGTYAQAVTAHKRQAQERLAQTVLQGISGKKLSPNGPLWTRRWTHFQAPRSICY